MNIKSSNSRKKNRIWIILGIFFLIFLGIQFIRPEVQNPVVTKDLVAPEQVKAIIKNACYDCHSNETNLRWYDKIVPVYQTVANDVKEARAVLNFSEWDKLAPGDQNGKLWEAINQISAGAMPLKGYTFVHPNTKVSEQDLKVLKDYLLTIAVKNIPQDTTKINVLNKQMLKLSLDSIAAKLPTTLNGITYDPDYKNWQPINTTQRFDNGTMRIIFGNTIATKAIREKHTNPWPDGTVLAKVAWDQLEDVNGVIHTGAFKQIEYMIKDSRKYASTKGWGFARFKTEKMLPYGKNINFAEECVNCHRPMRNNDYVFTVPIKDSPITASIGIPLDQTKLKAIRNFINKAEGTTSILYSEIKEGHERRTLYTWKQEDDPNWFGAKMAGKLISVKQITDISQQLAVMP